MPRIYDKNNNPLDYCLDCFPDEEQFRTDEGCRDDKRDVGKCRFCNLGHSSTEKSCHYSYNADHPPYEDTNYDCMECDCELTSEDN